MKQLFVFILLMFYFYSSLAQDFSGWREHLPYRKATQLVATNESLFCLTESGLFSYSFTDNEIKPFSKIKGLSDSDISSIAWFKQMNTLIIAYRNGNIDLISNGDIRNIPDIKRFATIGDKQINSITVYNNLAYLATNFGIVVLNLEKEEISDTYLIGLNGAEIRINDIAFDEIYIWAATEYGLFRADINSVNLADFNNWGQISSIPDFQRECEALEVANDVLYVLRPLATNASDVYKYQDNSWSLFISESEKICSIDILNGEVHIVKNKSVQVFDENGRELSDIQAPVNGNFRDVSYVSGRTFIADYERSMLEYEGGSFSTIKPDGPVRSKITSVYSVGKQTWAGAGVVDDNYENGNVEAELFLFENSEWTNFTNENMPELEGSTDISSIAGNSRDESRVYAGSWGDGIFEFENGEISNHWNSENSPLETKGVSSMASDREGTLWILDAGSNQPAKVLTYEGEWMSLSYTSINGRVDFQKIIALSNGDKWVLKSPGASLFVFNENGTPANGDDDISASFLLRDENNSTISSNVYDIVEDKEGNVWAATSNGVAVYADPGSIFRDGSFFAYRPVITVDGSTQYLLSTEKVQCIDINGANQKWLGTENSGVFLVSESGDEQLAHFNMANSPLPSDNILKISVNPETGEVFFITDGGMISYRGKVTEGTENYDGLYVYPNPVRETYHGDIIVSGLISESVVKITDVSGNLVWEGKSKGGQFVWDGKNFNGSRVHTGVYLIFCSNKDGSESKIIKLLFIH